MIFEGRKAREVAVALGLDGREERGQRSTVFRAFQALEAPLVSRSVAMKLTGHKAESGYRRYAIVSEADLSEGVAMLAALHQAEQGTPRKVGPLSERTAKVLAKS